MVTARSRSHPRVDSSSSEENSLLSQTRPDVPRSRDFSSEPDLVNDDPTILKIEVAAPGAPAERLSSTTRVVVKDRARSFMT